MNENITNRAELIDSFTEVLRDYNPDWVKIASINQHPKELSDEDARKKKVESFGRAIKEIRERRGLSMQQMGKRLSCTRQYVFKIETAGVSKLPIDKLERIAYTFGISPAFLIGLIDDETYMPDKIEYYFWENPDSEYLIIKDEIGSKPLINPVAFFGTPKTRLVTRIHEELKKELDYDFVVALDRIMSSEPKKRNAAFNLIKIMSDML